MNRIICVGSMNMDLVVYSATLPRPGETVFGTTLVSSPGGKGLNQAVAARRLGAAVAFVGNIGRDPTGDEIAAFLASEGIDTSGIGRIDGMPSGAAVIVVDAHAQNQIVIIPGANMLWQPGALDRLRPTRGDIVISQFEIPDAIVIAAFKRARAEGALTILNAAPARGMPKDLLALVDILVVNEVELAAVSGVDLNADDIVAVTVAALALAGPNLAVVATLGAKGAVVVEHNAVRRIEGLRVLAIDTAGAGDCFIGAMAAALVRGDTLVSATRIATRAASLSVTRKGTATAMPFLQEL
jgi:ribokinase